MINENQHVIFHFQQIETPIDSLAFSLVDGAASAREQKGHAIVTGRASLLFS
jgi:hypothetical protein